MWSIRHGNLLRVSAIIFSYYFFLIKKCEKVPNHVIDVAVEIDDLQENISKDSSPLVEMQLAYNLAHVYSIRMTLLSLDKKLTVIGIAIIVSVLVALLLNHLL